MQNKFLVFLCLITMAFGFDVAVAQFSLVPTPGDYVVFGVGSQQLRDSGVAANPSGQSGTLGVTNGSNACTGCVGEHIGASVASGSAISLTTATPLNVTSIILTPGDWDIHGSVAFTGSTTTISSGAMSLTSATFPTNEPVNGTVSQIGSTTANAPNAFDVGTFRQNVTVNTTVYLVAQSTFTGSNTVYGYIGARRVR